MKIGAFECFGEEAELLPLAAELALAPAAARKRVAEPVELAGRAAWLKAGPLHGAASWRHALRGLFLRRSVPRVREAENLQWLEHQHFQVPHPLAAGVLRRNGLPVYQFVITSRLSDVVPLPEWLAAASVEERALVLGEIASEVARMHALRFIHRDLYVRNLLIAPAREQRRVVFIDAWRGGPDLQLRGEAYDLACLFLQGAALFTQGEQRTLVLRYVEERARAGRPVDAAQLVARIRRERAALVRQALRDPGRRRAAQPPSADWTIELDAR